MASTTVTVYRNGDRNYPGKKLVVNRRQIRSFDAFLDIVTHEVKMKWGARAICTPTDGHKIKELDKIQTGGAYVAVGPEHFKKLGYKDIREPKALPRKMEEITPVRHSKLVMSGRARKVADAEATAHKIFFVFRNGDDLYPSRKMLLKKSDLSSMDRVLAFVTEKVHLQSGAVYCLCNLQGQEIKDTSELQNNAQYVAVGHGKKFKKVAYSDHGATSITPRRTVPKPKFQPYRKNVTKVKLTHSKRSSETSSKDYMQETPEDRRVVTKLEPFEDAKKVMQEEQIIDELVGSVSHLTQDGEEDTLEKTDEPEENVSRQIQEEENGERISSMLQTSEENSGLTEDTILRETGHLQNDQDESSSNLYNASGEQKEQGTEIKEDRDTVEDKPIDQLPAEEVVEEQIDKEPQLNERSDSLHE